MVTGEAGSAHDHRRRTAARRRLAGRDRVDCRRCEARVTRDVAVADPTLYFTHAFVLALIERGIAVRGLPVELPEPRNILAPLPRTVLVESQSPPLREIAATMMKVSQNLYAETLLKAVGAVKSGGTGSADAGVAAAREIFTAWNIPPGTYVQADGSGLSRYDFVTAEMIATLLERMHEDPRHRDAFVATLPIAGKDGTISTRMKNTRAEGNAVAKTGSISNVRALSGYVRTRDGETAGLLDPRQQLHDPRGDGELDRRPGRRAPGELFAPLTCSRSRRRIGISDCNRLRGSADLLIAPAFRSADDHFCFISRGGRASGRLRA